MKQSKSNYSGSVQEISIEHGNQFGYVSAIFRGEEAIRQARDITRDVLAAKGATDAMIAQDRAIQALQQEAQRNNALQQAGGGAMQLPASRTQEYVSV